MQQNQVRVKNVFAAVFDKGVLEPILALTRPVQPLRAALDLRFWGTEGTVRWLQSRGFKGTSVVKKFDYDGRVKSLDRDNFVRILADASKESHLAQLKKEGLEPIDCVIVDLYAPDPKIFPESMDIGGMSLIRAAIKNYKNVALAFDEKSTRDLAREIKKNSGSTTLGFRKKQAQSAAKFIASRMELEAELFEKILPADLV